jgi:hypothetical protein
MCPRGGRRKGGIERNQAIREDMDGAVERKRNFETIPVGHIVEILSGNASYQLRMQRRKESLPRSLAMEGYQQNK